VANSGEPAWRNQRNTHREGSALPGGGNALVTAATYNPDDTMAIRTDYAVSSTASTFVYDFLGRLKTVTSPKFASGVGMMIRLGPT
jgi:hypothetical protein